LSFAYEDHLICLIRAFHFSRCRNNFHMDPILDQTIWTCRAIFTQGLNPCRGP
jgi:hypothetical protein